MRRLLIYSQDGMGLGHLRRTRSIAREVLSREPDCSVLILADSPATPFFRAVEGIDYVKLPTVVKTGDTTWRAGSWSLDVEQVVRFRSKLILEAFRGFDPDAVLIDHMPVGALGELKPLLQEAAKGPRRPRLFLGLRDVLGAPEVIRRVWSDLGAYEYLDGYDALLIYGCREVYPVESAYALTPFAAKLKYCHYVAAAEPPEAASEAEHEPLILLTGGGGKDSHRLASAFLDALPTLVKEVRFNAQILTGPNMSPADRRLLSDKAANLPVELVHSTSDATTWLKRASIVVSMAGYNSLSEVLALRKKALVVPRPGPSREQRIRSALFSRLHLIRTLHPDRLNPARLAKELLRLHRDDGLPEPANIPPLDGARQAARLLVGRDVSPSVDHPVSSFRARPIG